MNLEQERDQALSDLADKTQQQQETATNLVAMQNKCSYFLNAINNLPSTQDLDQIKGLIESIEKTKASLTECSFDT